MIFLISMATASETQRTLSFRDALGRTFTMPVKVEEATETIPFDIQAEFRRIRQSDAARIFDISQMSKPEEEEALPFDLEKVIQSIR